MTDKERLEMIESDFEERSQYGGFLDDTDTDWLIGKVKEFERYKKYVMYFCGKDKVNDIRLAMQDKELD